MNQNQNLNLTTTTKTNTLSFCGDIFSIHNMLEYCNGVGFGDSSVESLL